MRRALALLAALAALALAPPAPARALPAANTSLPVGGGEEREPEPEDDSDSAPFMIVVEHGDGRRCGGSLVSLRTALTSAWCVRGTHGGDPRELRALAPAVPPARPVVRLVARVALAAGAEGEAPAPPPEWGGAELDIAVLELVAPFGGRGHSRPILMATRAEDCASGAVCHVVRAVGSTPRLRIVDAALMPDSMCGGRGSGWQGLRESALCLSGPTLCERDRGAGVVCDGKLCGVLSRSARTSAALVSNRTLDAVDAADARDPTCGDTHVAQSVARWRRFLHCAHTLRACERGGECAQLCTERQLLAPGEAREAAAGPLPMLSAPPADVAPPVSEAPAPLRATFKTLAQPFTFNLSTTTDRGKRRRTHSSALRTSLMLPTHSVPPGQPRRAGSPMSRGGFEFEPNRADFKAGEYGDNAADYGDEDVVLGGGGGGGGNGGGGSGGGGGAGGGPGGAVAGGLVAPVSPSSSRPPFTPPVLMPEDETQSPHQRSAAPLASLSDLSFIFVNVILYAL